MGCRDEVTVDVECGETDEVEEAGGALVVRVLSLLVVT